MADFPVFNFGFGFVKLLGSFRFFFSSSGFLSPPFENETILCTGVVIKCTNTIHECGHLCVSAADFSTSIMIVLLYVLMSFVHQSVFNNNCNLFGRLPASCTLSVCCDSYSDSCLVSRRYENIVVALCFAIIAVVCSCCLCLQRKRKRRKKKTTKLQIYNSNSNTLCTWSERRKKLLLVS